MAMIYFKDYHKFETTKVAFLDRDGVLNEDTHHICEISQLKIFTTAIEGLKKLNQNGFTIVVVTNQSGVARGYFSIEKMWEINDYLVDYFEKNGGIIHSVYCSPYLDRADFENEFVKITNCRKPGNGMIEHFLNRGNFSRKDSILFGDSERDLEAGKKSEIGHLISVGKLHEFSKLATQSIPTLGDWNP